MEVNLTYILVLFRFVGGRVLGEFGGSWDEKAIKRHKKHNVLLFSDEKTLIYSNFHYC